MELKRKSAGLLGRRLRGGDAFSLEMCMQIIMDVKRIGFNAEEKVPDKQFARPFALIANNNLVEYVFEWCAENDRDEFPISLAGLRNEGTKCVIYIPDVTRSYACRSE